MRSLSTQPDLFVLPPRLPEGFSYRENVISENEEANLVRVFDALPFKPFKFHGYLGNRRIVSFGWQYDYAKPSHLGSYCQPCSFGSSVTSLASIGRSVSGDRPWRMFVFVWVTSDSNPTASSESCLR